MLALEAYNLKKTYRFNNQIVKAVQNVSLNIASGEVVAFLGPNGAGKTTSIKMMAGLIKPDFGWTKISGINPHHNPIALEKLGAVLSVNELQFQMCMLELVNRQNTHQNQEDSILRAVKQNSYNNFYLALFYFLLYLDAVCCFGNIRTGNIYSCRYECN